MIGMRATILDPGGGSAYRKRRARKISRFWGHNAAQAESERSADWPYACEKGLDDLVVDRIGS